MLETWTPRTNPNAHRPSEQDVSQLCWLVLCVLVAPMRWYMDSLSFFLPVLGDRNTTNTGSLTRRNLRTDTIMNEINLMRPNCSFKTWIKQMLISNNAGNVDAKDESNCSQAIRTRRLTTLLTGVMCATRTNTLILGQSQLWTK
jgi:hypothetical protein